MLSAHFRGTPLGGKSIYVDPVAAFITTLLPILTEKAARLVNDIHKQPQYLSKFMAQILDFDDKLRRDFSYDAGNAELGWKGLAWDILDTYFDEWLQVEKAFAFERYHEIVESSENALIDYDSAEAGKTKPTHAAMMVTDLLRTITGQYYKLRRFSHKLRFLLHLQLKLLYRYHMRLDDAIEKYHALTSIVGRTVHGFTKEEQMAVEGIGGLEALCKVYGSADLVMRTLQDMSNEDVSLVMLRLSCIY